MHIAPILRLNAASCIGFGTLFVIAPASVADFLGSPPGWVLVALGLGLVANGGLLLVTARRDPVAASDLRAFAIGDGIWVVATLVLVSGGIWITTGPGQAAALAVAAMVGVFGALQWRAAQQTSDPA